jgi:hypothetical protein
MQVSGRRGCESSSRSMNGDVACAWKLDSVWRLDVGEVSRYAAFRLFGKSNSTGTAYKASFCQLMYHCVDERDGSGLTRLFGIGDSRLGRTRVCILGSSSLSLSLSSPPYDSLAIFFMDQSPSKQMVASRSRHQKA